MLIFFFLGDFYWYDNPLPSVTYGFIPDNISQNFLIDVDYSAIWKENFLRNESLPETPSSALYQDFIELVTKHNKNQSGMHVYQMYFKNGKMISFSEFWHLAQFTNENFSQNFRCNLRAVTHLGYHIQIENKVYFAFFTSHEVSNILLNGFINNIKTPSGSSIKFVNQLMIMDYNCFIKYFAIINDFSIVPTNLRIMQQNILLEQAFEAYECTLKNNKNLLFDGSNFIIQEDFSEQIKDEILHKIKDSNYRNLVFNNFFNNTNYHPYSLIYKKHKIFF